MKYLLVDSNLILHLLRGDETGNRCKRAIDTLGVKTTTMVSVVTIAELESLKKKQNWGANRCAALDAFLRGVIAVDIMSTDYALIEAYSAIDAYSQGKAADPSGAHLPGSARNMGKNDLWIAATAHVLGATLFTTDKDFAHLDHTFLDIVIVS